MKALIETGRVVVPIHNEKGELLAYAGRAVDSSEPKYKFPAGFRKSHVLFNLHRVLEVPEPRRVIVVEGFFDAMKVNQAGFPCVVGLMGSTLSDAQKALLAARFREVILMLDGDEAGQKATVEITIRLARNVFVRICDVPAGKQPDQLASEEITKLLSSL